VAQPAPHAHVVVRIPPNEILLIRRTRQGRVYHVAPGVPVLDGETPGAAAARAAQEELGLEVTVDRMLHAQAFSGVDHFFFMATAGAGVEGATLAHERDDFELDTELDGTYELVRLRATELLAYDVRPLELAQSVVRE
jgi:8-oxo-dGTP diphosphatase